MDALKWNRIIVDYVATLCVASHDPMWWNDPVSFFITLKWHLICFAEPICYCHFYSILWHFISLFLDTNEKWLKYFLNNTFTCIMSSVSMEYVRKLQYFHFIHTASFVSLLICCGSHLRGSSAVEVICYFSFSMLFL